MRQLPHRRPARAPPKGSLQPSAVAHRLSAAERAVHSYMTREDITGNLRTFLMLCVELEVTPRSRQNEKEATEWRVEGVETKMSSEV